jgi:hypothetical protein
VTESDHGQRVWSWPAQPPQAQAMSHQRGQPGRMAQRDPSPAWKSPDAISEERTQEHRHVHPTCERPHPTMLADAFLGPTSLDSRACSATNSQPCGPIQAARSAYEPDRTPTRDAAKPAAALPTPTPPVAQRARARRGARGRLPARLRAGLGRHPLIVRTLTGWPERRKVSGHKSPIVPSPGRIDPWPSYSP